jgi:hypothetical protein
MTNHQPHGDVSDVAAEAVVSALPPFWWTPSGGWLDGRDTTPERVENDSVKNEEQVVCNVENIANFIECVDGYIALHFLCFYG